jgi:hypothetical protein
VEVTHSGIHDLENDIGVLGQRRDSPTSIAKPVRPTEFSMWMAFPFVTLFVTLAIALGVIYAKARYQGMFPAYRIASLCGIIRKLLTHDRTPDSIL